MEKKKALSIVIRIALVFALATVLGLIVSRRFKVNTGPVGFEYREGEGYSLDSISQILDCVEQEKGDPKMNTVISETSLNMCMSMLFEGAEENTASYQELLDYLSNTHYPQDAQKIREQNQKLLTAYSQKSVVKVSMANGLWCDQDREFTGDYRKLIAGSYRGKAEKLDFEDPASADRINRWVASKTGKKINEITSPDDLYGNDLALLNALYFKGEWKEIFDAGETEKGHFRNADGSEAWVEFMWEKHHTGYYENGSCRAFVKPYRDSSFVFIGILPNGEIHNSRDMNWEEPVLEFQVSDLDLDSLLSNVSYERDFKIAIPIMEIEDENQLLDIMRKNGLGNALGEGNEDYTMTVSNEPLNVTSLRQKTYLKIDERGTEAAASTFVMVSQGIETSGPRDIVLDRPFVFLIYDQTARECLFIGKINDLSP